GVFLGGCGKQKNAIQQNCPAMQSNRASGQFGDQPLLDEIQSLGGGGVVGAGERAYQTRLHELRRVGGIEARKSGHAGILIYSCAPTGGLHPAAENRSQLSASWLALLACQPFVTFFAQ